MGKKNKQASANDASNRLIGPTREHSPPSVVASGQDALRNRIRSFYNAGLVVPQQLLAQPNAKDMLMEIANEDGALPTQGETATSTTDITVNVDPNSQSARSSRFKEARRQLENAWRTRRPYGNVDVHNRLDSAQWKLLVTETSVENPNIYVGGIAPEPPSDDGLFDTRATLAVEDASLQGLLSIFDEDEPEERLVIPDRYALQANLMPVNREGHYMGGGAQPPPTSRLAYRLRAYEELKEDLLLLAKPSKAASDSKDTRRARVSKLEEMAHTSLMMNVHQLQRLDRLHSVLETLCKELHLDTAAPNERQEDESNDKESASDSDEPSRRMMASALDTLALIERSALLSLHYTRNVIHQARYNAGELVTSAKPNRKRFKSGEKPEKRQKKGDARKRKAKDKVNSSQQAL